MNENDFVEKFVELALRYDCDKAIDHDYASFYAGIFGAVTTEKPRMLEIGVGGYADPFAGGASAQLWSNLLSEWSIIAIDVSHKELTWPDRVTFARADQNDPGQLQQIGEKYGPFDVIIDDGSHINQHVRTSLSSLFPYLTESGFYVIEDVQTSYLPRYGGSLSRDTETTANLARDLFDFVNSAELPAELQNSSLFHNSIEEVRFRHNIVSIQKKTAKRVSNLNSEGVEAMLGKACDLLHERHGAGRWLRPARYLMKLQRLKEAEQYLRAGQIEFPENLAIKRMIVILEEIKGKA